MAVNICLESMSIKGLSSVLTSEYRIFEMNRLCFSLIFLGGIGIAIFLAYWSQYFGPKGASFKIYEKPFSPLPDIRYLQTVDDAVSVLPTPLDEEFTKQSVKHKTYDKEALSSLQAALELLKDKKIEKARRLFEHAAALSPKHSDILNQYGEFIEDIQNDLVMADTLYFKALTYSPEHSRAFSNHQRILAIVEEMDRNMLKKIDEKRDQIALIPDSNRALQRAKKEAYFQHIYHTLGIEGNTMTLSQTRSVVETQMAVGGKSLMEHNEILGLDAAMKYINSTLVNRFGPFRLQDILEIHRRVLGFVDPFESGEFRRTQVYVGGHIPPSPDNIEQLMKEFILWLNSEDAARMHPVRYATTAHYKLVHIHPFTDGNGRVSRLLMNTILMQAGFPPVIIHKQERHRYYECIEAANEGDIRPFFRFIAEATDNTLDLFLWATKEYLLNIPALDQQTIVIDNNEQERSDVQVPVY